MRPALFLDRDGVIIVDKGYVHRVEDWEFRREVILVVRGFRALGHLVIVVTNQSGLGRGIFTDQQYTDLTNYYLRKMDLHFRAPVDEVYTCPHTPSDHCACRKPRPGLILRAAKDHDIDLAASTLIGDKQTDIDAGRAAGVGHLILWR